MKVFVIDKNKCVGCHGCQIACKDEHCGNDWMPYAKPQPDTGHFWMRVDEKTHGQIPKVKVEYTPVMCQHCEDCALMRIAPEAVYRREDGLVILDPEKSAGREDLATACPYHAVYYNVELGVPQKCTGCAHMVDAGELPHCVDVCATGALRFGDYEDFADELAEATTLLPQANTKPHAFYLNEPGLFIGGEVWDPASNEIIEGATVRLAGADGFEATALTDDFGDFWFRKLKPGAYDLSVEADGFAGAEKRGIRLDESLNVGDFALEAR